MALWSAHGGYRVRMAGTHETLGIVFANPREGPGGAAGVAHVGGLDNLPARRHGRRVWWTRASGAMTGRFGVGVLGLVLEPPPFRVIGL